MPKFLEARLRQQAAAEGKTGRAADRYVYGAMNDLGAMKGNQETPKGRRMELQHDRDTSAAKKQMGRELLQRIGGSGASFALGTPELQRGAEDIIKTFKVGLRRFAKAMEPTKKLKLKAFRDRQRLVFWYSA